MKKRDLIDAFADAMDKHTKSIDEVHSLMCALDDVSDFMSGASAVMETDVCSLGIALRMVEKSSLNEHFIDKLHDSVFNNIEAVMLAKQNREAFQIIWKIAGDCTNNDELMSAMNED